MTALRNLEKSYSHGVSKTFVLRQIDLDVKEGEFLTAQGQEIMELFTQLNQGGKTIIQVTHSEANAAYGRWVIELRDGWVVKE
jgi:ABC-type lipoprotein export system ATPase subunit